MNNYMQVLPLKCPKCKKVIPYTINKIRNKEVYSQCPKCKYYTKTPEKFVDKTKKEIKSQMFISDYAMTKSEQDLQRKSLLEQINKLEIVVKRNEQILKTFYMDIMGE